MGSLYMIGCCSYLDYIQLIFDGDKLNTWAMRYGKSKKKSDEYSYLSHLAYLILLYPQINGCNHYIHIWRL